MRTKKGVNPSIERQINTSINCCRHLCTCNRKRKNEGGTDSEGMGEWDTTTVCSRNIEIHMPLFDCREWEEKTQNKVTFATLCTRYLWEQRAWERSMWFYFRCNRQSAHNSRNEIFARIRKVLKKWKKCLLYQKSCKRRGIKKIEMHIQTEGMNCRNSNRK